MEIRSVINEICHAAVEAVTPRVFIPSAVHMEGSCLKISDDSYDLSCFRHIYAAAIGKAAVGMAEALDSILHSFITEGIVLTKHIPQNHNLGNQYRILKGGHPVPDKGSLEGAEAVLALLKKAENRDLVIFLISGGGSALMTKPAGGIDLETLQTFSRQILACGADISEFNTLRKHLDLVKGGGLARQASPAKQITLILSDVVGNPLDVIASGPTIPDKSTFRDAMTIFDRYSRITNFPEQIRNTLIRGCRGELPETLKENDPDLPDLKAYILASNRTAAQAAAHKAAALGLNASVVTTELTGDADVIGKLLPNHFADRKAGDLLIFGGETTVKLHGKGAGGRNTQLALASVRAMADCRGCTLFTLATDGEDGPTDAAGAIVTDDTLAKALQTGHDPDEYLRNNDSYRFFYEIGGLISTGSTGTNVNDLTFLLKLVE